MHSHRRHKAWPTSDSVAIEAAVVREEYRENASDVRIEVSAIDGNSRRTDVIQCGHSQSDETHR